MTSVEDGNDDTFRRIQEVPNNSNMNDVKEDEEEEDAGVAEMERLLAQQEEEHDEHEHKHHTPHLIHEHDNVNQQQQANNNNNAMVNDEHPNVIPNPGQLQPEAQPRPEANQDPPNPIPNAQPTNTFSSTTSRTSSLLKANYTTLSVIATIIHILYVLRTRKQIYLSLMFLTTSRVSYILIGNMILSLFISMYQFMIKTFLNGLRLIESESIAESIRWNITESVFALTMFRQEVNVKMMGLFLIVFWLKVLHWAVELRGSHLRMTEEVFYFLEDEEGEIFTNHGLNDNAGGGTSDVDDTPAANSKSMLYSTLALILPNTLMETYEKANQKIPRMRKPHFKYWMLMNILYGLDLAVVAYSSNDLISTGPSASILFLFEAAIMLITVLFCFLQKHSYLI